MLIKTLFSDPHMYVLWVAVVMFSICLHEYAHAWMALREGDSTAADAGHLSLDPRVQMGGFSIFVLLLIGIAWGAVPVTPSRMRRHASEALVAFAGPASNLILFFSFAVLLAITQAFGPHLNNPRLVDGFHALFSIGALLNLVLALFNMLPLPILDGWKVFAYFIPRLEDINPETRNTAGLILFMLLMFGGFNYIYAFAGALTHGLLAVLVPPLARLAGT